MEIAVAIMGIEITLFATILTYLAWRNGKIIEKKSKFFMGRSRKNMEIVIAMLEIITIILSLVITFYFVWKIGR